MLPEITTYSDSSGGSRLGHKIPGTLSKFPNLNENGQKSLFCEVFLPQNPVNLRGVTPIDWDTGCAIFKGTFLAGK